MPIDYTTALGKVRAAIPDVDESDPILTDDQINSYLAVNRDNVKLAVASAWRAIATETNLLFKYVKTDDLLVDGPKMADTLLKAAKDIEASAIAEIETEADETFTLTPYNFTLEDSWYSLGQTS